MTDHPDGSGGYGRAQSHPPLHAGDYNSPILRRGSADSGGRKKLKYASGGGGGPGLHTSIANSIATKKMGNVYHPRGGAMMMSAADQSIIGGSPTIVTEAKTEKTEKTSSISSSSTGSRRRKQERERQALHGSDTDRITPIMEIGGDNFVQQLNLAGEQPPPSARGGGAGHSGGDRSRGSNHSKGGSFHSGSGNSRGESFHSGSGHARGGGTTTSRPKYESKLNYSAMDWPSAPPDAFMDDLPRRKTSSTTASSYHSSQHSSGGTAENDARQQHYPSNPSPGGGGVVGSSPGTDRPAGGGGGAPGRRAVLHACDDRGRCLFHPHVVLRKKVILGVMGGWKDVLPSCPECEQEDVMGGPAAAAASPPPPPTGGGAGRGVDPSGRHSALQSSMNTHTSMAVIAPEGRSQKYALDRNPKNRVKFDKHGEGLDGSTSSRDYNSSREHVLQGSHRTRPSYASYTDEEFEEEEEGESFSEEEDDGSSSGDSSGSSSESGSSSSSSSRGEPLVGRKNSAAGQGSGERLPPRPRMQQGGGLRNSFKKNKAPAPARGGGGGGRAERRGGGGGVGPERRGGGGSNTATRKPKKNRSTKSSQDDFISAYIGTGVPSRSNKRSDTVKNALGFSKGAKDLASSSHSSKYPQTLSPDNSMESGVAGSSSTNQQGGKKVLKGVSKLIRKSKKKISKSVNKAMENTPMAQSSSRTGRAHSFEEDYDNYDYSEESDYEEYDNMYGSSQEKQIFFDRYDPPAQGGGASSTNDSREANPSRRRDRSKEKYLGDPPRRDRSKEKYYGEPPRRDRSKGKYYGDPPRRDRSKEKYIGEPPRRDRSKEMYYGEPPRRDRSKEKYIGEPPRRDRSKEKYCGEPPRRDRSKEKYCGEPPRRDRSKEKYIGEPPRRDRSKEKYIGEPPRRDRSKEKYTGEPPWRDLSKDNSLLPPDFLLPPDPLRRRSTESPPRRRDRSKEKYHGESPFTRRSDRSKEKYFGESPPTRQRSKEKYRGNIPPRKQHSKGSPPRRGDRSKEKYYGESPPARQRSKEKYRGEAPRRRLSKEKFLGQPMPVSRGKGRSFHGEHPRTKRDPSGRAEGRSGGGKNRGNSSRRSQDTVASHDSGGSSHRGSAMEVESADVSYQWDRVPLPEPSLADEVMSTEESEREEDPHGQRLQDVAYQWDRVPFLETLDNLLPESKPRTSMEAEEIHPHRQSEEEARAESEYQPEQRQERTHEHGGSQKLRQELYQERLQYHQRLKSQEDQRTARSQEDEDERAAAHVGSKAKQRSWHTAPEAESSRSLSPTSAGGRGGFDSPNDQEGDARSLTVLDMEAASTDRGGGDRGNGYGYGRDSANDKSYESNNNSNNGLLSMDDLLQSIQEDIAMPAGAAAVPDPTPSAKLDRSSSAPTSGGGGGILSRVESKDYTSMPQLDRSATGFSSRENSSSQEHLLDASMEDSFRMGLVRALVEDGPPPADGGGDEGSSSSSEEERGEEKARKEEEVEEVVKEEEQPPAPAPSQPPPAPAPSLPAPASAPLPPPPAPAALPGFGNYGGLKIDLSSLQASKPAAKPKVKADDPTSGGMKVDLSQLQAFKASKPSKKPEAKEEKGPEEGNDQSGPELPPPPPLEVDMSLRTFDVNNLPYTGKFGESGMYTGSVNEQYEPHRKGTMVYDNGEILKGYWNNGDLVRESELYSDDDDDDEEDDEGEMDDLSSSMANIGSKKKNNYAGAAADRRSRSRSRSRSREPPKPAPPPPPPPKPKTPSPPPPEYKVGDPGNRRDMIMDKEESLILIEQLKFGDGAFIRRSDGKWSYAVVKSLEETEEGKSAIRFLVNNRNSSKSYAKKYWGTHVRPLKGTKKRPPTPEKGRGASSESREGRSKRREDEGSSSSSRPKADAAPGEELDRGTSCPPTQSRLTRDWGMGPPVRHGRSRSRSRRRAVSFSPMRPLMSIAESDVEDEEDEEEEELLPGSASGSVIAGSDDGKET